MKKALFSLVALMLLALSGIAQSTYTLVNSASQLEADAQYILVGYDNDGQAFVMSYQKSNNRHALVIEEVGGIITATVATDPQQQDAPYEFTLGGTPGAWTIYDPLNEGYLYAPGGGNYLRTQSTLDDKGRWTISDGEEGGMVPVSNGGEEQCYMRYNITSTLFGCYKESSSVVAPVYFFKAGSAQPDPEPSNYPTNFSAHVDGTTVTLTWDDAVGPVLPHKYLVLASTTSIVVPEDGTPVAPSDLNDNVPYGVETYSFTGLQPNTNYIFAIFPFTNSGANIDYKTDGNWPTTNATTEDVHYLLDEDFAEDLGVFTAFDVYGEQGWHQGVYQGTTYANMNGYANGAAHQNEDWLIGYVDLMGVTYNEIWLEFSTAKKYDGAPLRVAVSSDYDGQSDPSNDYDAWEYITDVFEFSTGEYEWVYSGKVDIAGMVPNYPCSFYVAFIYNSDEVNATSWEIDYVTVTGTNVNAVNEFEAASVSLYPNPATTEVSFALESDAQVSVFDLTGRKVNEMNAEAGQVKLNVSELESGIYFVNVRYTNGDTAVSKFVKF